MPFPLRLHRLLAFGRRSELLGLDYLRSLGFRIAASPYRTKTGEVDIVAWDGDVLVFVEVKSRQSTDPPENAVSMQKRARIVRTARTYIDRYNMHDCPYRFDILAVNLNRDRKPEFRLLRDAFQAREQREPHHIGIHPMLGFRGASRYYDPRYREGFALECAALLRVRRDKASRT